MADLIAADCLRGRSRLMPSEGIDLTLTGVGIDSGQRSDGPGAIHFTSRCRPGRAAV